MQTIGSVVGEGYLFTGTSLPPHFPNFYRESKSAQFGLNFRHHSPLSHPRFEILQDLFIYLEFANVEDTVMTTQIRQYKNTGQQGSNKLH